MVAVETVELPTEWSDVDETVLGGGGVVELPLPNGLGYGGADIWSCEDASGTIYVVLCVERSKTDFGTYAFRKQGSGPSQWIELLERTPNRVTASEEWPKGVFLTWLAPGDRVVRRGMLPGFICPSATGVATPIQVVLPTAPGQTGGGAGVDAEARKQIQDNAKQDRTLRGRMDALEKTVNWLSTRPVTVDGEQLVHALWTAMIERNKLRDGLYMLLSKNEQGLIGQLWRVMDEWARARQVKP